MRTRVRSAAAWTTGVMAAAALGTLLGGCASSPGSAIAPASASGSAPDAAAAVATGPNGSGGFSSGGGGGFSGKGRGGGHGTGLGAASSTSTSGVGLNGANAGTGAGSSGLGGAAGTGPGYHDSRITLPDTVSLDFPRTKQTDRTEREVLSTVQQALRAQLHAVYNASAASTASADPLLSLYWAAPALAAAQREITTWVKKGRQPVGMLVITGTDYTAPDATGKSVVNYCANWSGQAATHSTTVVVPISALGTYNTLTLIRADRHHWQVQTLASTANSADCST